METETHAVHGVMPVHNNVERTLDCLECLTRQTYKRLRILIIDDGSTDGTAAEVRARYPDVEVLSGNGSLWWTDR